LVGYIKPLHCRH